MKTPVLEPTSAAKSGWVIILLTVGWMGFMLWPWPKDKPAAKPAAIPVPATSLTRSGLAEYTDWEGLPEIFAIWADKAEWKDGKTRFAYWHPVRKNYSYYFEATKTASGYRFREIAEPKDPSFPEYYWDESLGDDCPIRFYRQRGIVYDRWRSDDAFMEERQRANNLKRNPEKTRVVIPMEKPNPIPPKPPDAGG